MELIHFIQNSKETDFLKAIKIKKENFCPTKKNVFTVHLLDSQFT